MCSQQRNGAPGQQGRVRREPHRGAECNEQGGCQQSAHEGHARIGHRSADATDGQRGNDRIQDVRSARLVEQRNAGGGQPV